MAATPLRIFLVENHEDSLRYLTLYLEECGHGVQTARSMQGALESLSATRVDVLLCDIGLPDGDGWQLLKKMSEGGIPCPYAIAMSGFCSRADIEKSRACGFQHHITKPFLPQELDDLLVLGAHHVKEEPFENHAKKHT